MGDLPPYVLNYHKWHLKNLQKLVPVFSVLICSLCHLDLTVKIVLSFINRLFFTRNKFINIISLHTIHRCGTLDTLFLIENLYSWWLCFWKEFGHFHTLWTIKKICYITRSFATNLIYLIYTVLKRERQKRYCKIEKEKETPCLNGITCVNIGW